ncbi:NAD(P)H-dependent oxidoreductase [Rariglobus hedericola]|uniref:NAD(P)H-dependent oxidoreductase n=1 Tax=Rariglobus hedericola TaxID=2597822 RepID=A0A556QQ03_9BACT|nr:NAD(P)H-dependent oxidoreductase [Rariglobus hedericola]TSJ78717.1 NAD(P)H-dependent oxidoreductase [Rariglobus hedericola]
MTTIPTGQLLDALKWRYATKKFDAQKKIPAETWTALEESLVLSPSSFGAQPWKFIVVDNAELRAKLVSCSWGQTQVAEASHLVIFVFKTNLDEAHIDRYMERTAEVRGITTEAMAPFKKVIMGSLDGARAKGFLDTWQSRQVYIALGQFMASAALLGIDTCPMEGIEPAKYDELLGLTGTGYTTLCACPAGYRAADDKYAALPKVRFPIADVITHI